MVNKAQQCNTKPAYLMSHLIQLQNISKTYGVGDLQVYALKSVDVTIDVGEYCAIMGPSGSGQIPHPLAMSQRVQTQGI